MEITIHPQAKANFDHKVVDLLSQIIKIDRQVAPRSWRGSEFYVAHRITEKDIIGEPQLGFTNGFGEQTGLAFVSSGKEHCFIGKGYDALMNLADELHRVPQLRGIASKKFITGEILDWVRSSYLTGTRTSFIDTLASKLAAAVKRYEVWIPIPFTSIEKDFMLGRVRFKTITSAQITQWFDMVRAHWTELNLDEDGPVRELEERMRKEFQGYAAGIYECEAEPGRAKEMAYAYVADSLSILRLHSAASFTPRAVSGAYEYGRRMMRVEKYLLVKEGDWSFTEGIVDKGLRDWRVDARTINRITTGKWNEILSIDRPNDFQKRLLDALRIYSKSAIRHDLYDRLLYILAALESMLLKDSSEPIQQNLGDRLAFIIAETSDARKKVVQNVRNIYNLRSQFLHHGQAESSLSAYSTVEEFMLNAWVAFYKMLDSMNNYRTRKEYIDAVDDLRYS